MRGLITVSSAAVGGLHFRGVLTGLLPLGVGSWHVHEGFACAASGGHYFDAAAGPDPWNAPLTYTANSAGVATIDTLVADSPTPFSLYDAWPVAGRALVVHDPANAPVPSARAGCGVIGEPTTAVATLGPYPGSARDSVGGTLRVTYDSATSTLTIDGLVSGLTPDSAGGWHVHEGYTCTDASAVGGHFFAPGTPDAWQPLAYAADSSGVARISVRVHGYSLAAALPVGAAAVHPRGMPTLGRAIVFHGANGARIGCGLIEPLYGEAVAVGRYPGYAGAAQINGLLTLRPDGADGLLIAGEQLARPHGTGASRTHSAREEELRV